MADGVIVGLGLTPEVIELSLAAIERGARAVGRRLADLDVWWFAKTNVADTREAAVRPITMALAASANHAFRFTLEGKGVPAALHEPIRGLQREYDSHHHEIAGAGNAALTDRWGLTDFLVDRFAIAGTPAECVVQIRRAMAAGARSSSPPASCPTRARSCAAGRRRSRAPWVSAILALVRKEENARMKTARALGVVVGLGAAILLLATQTRPGAQPADPALRIGPTELGGIVTSANGPEAGVWVIAETTDLPTQVRQDRRDRRPWALRHAGSAEGELRACGCAAMGSSTRRRSRPRPASCSNLTAVVAPSAAAAAEYYPAIYWYSMLRVPEQERVPRHRPRRQRHHPGREEPGAVAGRREDQRLLHLSPARQQGDPHDPARSSATSRPRSTRGSGASSRARP